MATGAGPRPRWSSGKTPRRPSKESGGGRRWRMPGRGQARSPQSLPWNLPGVPAHRGGVGRWSLEAGWRPPRGPLGRERRRRGLATFRAQQGLGRRSRSRLLQLGGRRAVALRRHGGRRERRLRRRVQPVEQGGHAARYRGRKSQECLRTTSALRLSCARQALSNSQEGNAMRLSPSVAPPGQAWRDVGAAGPADLTSASRGYQVIEPRGGAPRDVATCARRFGRESLQRQGVTSTLGWEGSSSQWALVAPGAAATVSGLQTGGSQQEVAGRWVWVSRRCEIVTTRRAAQKTQGKLEMSKCCLVRSSALPVGEA